jgi:hypothetical protein
MAQEKGKTGPAAAPKSPANQGIVKSQATKESPVPKTAKKPA